MKKTKTIRFVESFIILPIMTMTIPLGNIPGSISAINQPQVAFISPAVSVDPTLKLEADAIDAYFAAHDMPLEGMGLKMAEEAEANDLDWRLLPAIAVRESTGGKFDCKKAENNPFGWGSCKISFKTLDETIETVAKNLGGNNPNTARHYDNKTTKQILNAYNPPSIVPRYAEQVLAIMKDIGREDMAAISSTVAANI
ncbi:glucosaminidase domain-containing protein [Candidatus Nomurabacteria bacterium]|nr:glucosaminidase domain-containing protein [Candidatus Nomurabacteria bacterium]